MPFYKYKCVLGVDDSSVRAVAEALGDILGLMPTQLIPLGVGIVMTDDRHLDTENWPLNGYDVRVLVNCTGEEEHFDTGVYKGPRPGDADVVVMCTAYNRTPNNWVSELSRRGIKCRLLRESQSDYTDVEFRELVQEVRAQVAFLLKEGRRTDQDNLWRLEPPNTPAGRPPEN